ncbi:MAG: immunoglobulin domain-containing protein [Eubacteriales bacterium]|nr:immunoglobulin domain-containing protein [Eubacteriales bacterium]
MACSKHAPKSNTKNPQGCAINNPMVGMVSIVDGKQVALSAAEQPDEYITYQVTVNDNGNYTVDVTNVSASTGNSTSSYMQGVARAALTMPEEGAPYIAPSGTVQADMAYNDLSLEASLKYEPTLGYYIDAGIQAHDGVGSPDGKTSISLNIDGASANVWDYTFQNQLTERYGYNLVIPLDNVAHGAGYTQMELAVKGTGEYNEFDDGDNAVMLTGESMLRIDQQPQSVTATVGEKVTFSVQVSGGRMPYLYQWQMLSGDQWVDIPGANASQYSISSVTENMLGRQYRCIITDAAMDSVTTQIAALSGPPPQTGDRELIAGYVALCLLAVACCLAVIMFGRKEENL